MSQSHPDVSLRCIKEVMGKRRREVAREKRRNPHQLTFYLCSPLSREVSRAAPRRKSSDFSRCKELQLFSPREFCSSFVFRKQRILIRASENSFLVPIRLVLLPFESEFEDKEFISVHALVHMSFLIDGAKKKTRFLNRILYCTTG